MKTKFSLLLLILLYNSTINIYSQETIKLEEVVVTGNRITIPFSKSSRTITIISAKKIATSTASNIADLLQNFAGVDVRRRGIDGMQSDLYIRGGNFNQTLILIDGVKMDDAQTGHHTMNALLLIENIERIEIIKGPAARIYGQNAFTGAINIITKKITKSALNLRMNYGSFDNSKVNVSMSQKSEASSVLASISYQESDGYRFNTDFSNVTALLKTTVNDYNFLSSFTQRKFGANGFYASPNFKDQYEETQTSLVAVSKSFKGIDITYKPQIYWRRNQDMYLFLRHNPSYYRNLHVSNKVGVETNIEISSTYGKTGLGLDVSRLFLVSNNLGNHQRTALTAFLEHRFVLLNGDLDITLGVALNYYSDFETKAFPGLDVGYSFSDEFKVYGNIGYTYRVPTFTDLFYIGPTTQGNSNLEAESALAEELGFKFKKNRLALELVLFNRVSDNLIDWTKENETDKWETRNFSKVTTRGFETTLNYDFNLLSESQSVRVSYNFIDDTIKDANVQFTRYSLNSMKHQVTTGLDLTFNKTLSQSVSYRYVERTDGEKYQVVDTRLILSLNKGVELSLTANNIFNALYTETNLVPMPRSTILFGFVCPIY